MNKLSYFVGLDIGSTTVKVVVTHNKEVIYSTYERHFSNIKELVSSLLKKVAEKLKDTPIGIAATGSGGLFISQWLNIPFVQEVVASTKAVESVIPQTDCAIELGGEDAKITFFGQSFEQRMNGTCAGGTGSFIDQMASLLKTDAAGLNELAKNHSVIYPIASRCGVFSKTDIQPLINEGAEKSDIAASIFQAVVNQTISGLACGHPIRGNVAFLGGPLYFLSELRERFIDTLKLKEDQIVFPENSNLFVALGAAMYAEKTQATSMSEILEVMERNKDFSIEEVERLEPLFKKREDYEVFKARHDAVKVKRKDLSNYQGQCFLGLDVGSTTTKAVLIGEDNELIYEYYNSNEGSPLDKSVEILKTIYQNLPESATIGRATVTGYGESLIKQALKIDIGEIETIAHYTGAMHFLPDVTFILDIGGQDMKCMKIRNGAIDSIILNEACSSGCGSFLETFAKSLNLTISDFVKEAVKAQNPVDLGTRCTVFMNSRVKQAQKEGASVGDIAAGLSYSVVKNALQKVIKLRNNDELGDHIMLQGGTFNNEAVLRTFEKITGKNAIRSDIAGLMGAFGAALIAKQSYLEDPDTKSTLLTLQELENLTTEIKHRRCNGCSNNCLLTVNVFNDGSRHITGNRCEIGAGVQTKKSKIPNLYQYKYERLFDYEPLHLKDAPRGVLGIPRVLNLYENYPFWFTFLTELGYRVVLSGESDHNMYTKGIESIPSESVCYPAKLAHGHIESLIEMGIQTIFYPCIPYEKPEYESADNFYNCPIVMSYPETIKHNIGNIKDKNVRLINPFIAFNDRKKMIKKLIKLMAKENISAYEVKRACRKAFEEDERFKEDIRRKGEETIAWLSQNNKTGIVLAGRPYHVDPEVHHGVDKLITGLGMAVLTEDAVAHLCDEEIPLRVLDQWKYHSRLYRATEYVTQSKHLELVQLTSFGCGLDAVTSDQVQELLEREGKIYTLIKIDEISNLGAIRIRLRSLKAAIEKRDVQSMKIEAYDPDGATFTREMKRTHTLLMPQMSPIHFDLIAEAMRYSGYNVELLPTVDNKAVEEGLNYVNNDACYPSILTTGQVMTALKSGKYDLNQVSVLMTQTGGPCRASNYVGFLRKALNDSNMGHIPVVSVNLNGIESAPGFKITLPLLHKVIIACIYGDLLQRLLYASMPYEAKKGSAYQLYAKHAKRLKKELKNPRLKQLNKNCKKIVEEFDRLPRIEKKIPKVAIVGEILVKYHPMANNRLADFLMEEGCEVFLPDLIDFLLYCFYNQIYKHDELSGSYVAKQVSVFSIQFIEKHREQMKLALNNSRHFTAPGTIEEKAKKVQEFISLGNQGGEGWYLTAEMMELIEEGVENIVCVQPFACLPNHVMGKGMIKPIRQRYPKANITTIDYDPGASEVNQINRIKLMLATAYKNIEEQTA